MGTSKSPFSSLDAVRFRLFPFGLLGFVRIVVKELGSVRNGVDAFRPSADLGDALDGNMGVGLVAGGV